MVAVFLARSVVEDLEFCLVEKKMVMIPRRWNFSGMPLYKNINY